MGCGVTGEGCGQDPGRAVTAGRGRPYHLLALVCDLTVGVCSFSGRRAVGFNEKVCLEWFREYTTVNEPDLMGEVSSD